MIRPLGIGTLIGGALMGVVTAFPLSKVPLSLWASAAKSKSVGSNIGGDELSLNVVIGGGLFAVAVFFLASYLTPGVSFGQALISAYRWYGLAGCRRSDRCSGYRDDRYIPNEWDGIDICDADDVSFE